MTPYVTQLLDVVKNRNVPRGVVRELVAYIEELERKAKAYDADYNPPRLGDQTYGK